MKRIMSLFLAVVLLLAFTACGQKPAEGEKAPEGGAANTENSVWTELLKEEHYDNVTIVCDAVFLSGYEAAESQNSNIFRFDGDAVSVDGALVDRQTAESLRAACMGVMLAVLSRNEDFSCDEATNTYAYRNEVAYSAYVMGYQTDMTVRNATVTLDGNGEVSQFACEMDQAFTEDGEQMKFVLNVRFTFSDFGATVVE